MAGLKILAEAYLAGAISLAGFQLALVATITSLTENQLAELAHLLADERTSH